MQLAKFTHLLQKKNINFDQKVKFLTLKVFYTNLEYKIFTEKRIFSEKLFTMKDFEYQKCSKSMKYGEK